MSPPTSVLERPTFEEGRELVREAYELVIDMLDRARDDALLPPDVPERRRDLSRVRRVLEGLLPYFDNPLEILEIVGCETEPGQESLSRPHASDKKVRRLADLLEVFDDIVGQLHATLGDVELTLKAARSPLVTEQVQALDVEAGVTFGLGAVC